MLEEYPKLSVVVAGDLDELATIEASHAGFLVRIEQALQTIGIGRARPLDPVSDRMFASIESELDGATYFEGDVRVACLEVLSGMLAFLRYRYNVEPSYAVEQAKYLFAPPDGGGRALEEELAKDLYHFFTIVGLSGKPHYEVRGLGTGRVDLLITFGAFELSIEAKRELTDASRAALGVYLGQAASYAAAGVRLGFLVVLDLTPKPMGVEAFESLVWVERVPGVTSDDLERRIVVAKLPGNRQPPSALSRARRNPARRHSRAKAADETD